jgi:hypothetical protein
MSAHRPFAETLQLIEAVDTELRAWQTEERAKAAARWAELEPLIRQIRELAALDRNEAAQ